MNDLKPGQKVAWDSDPSSDECVIWYGEFVEYEGNYAIVSSPEYRRHLLTFWKVRNFIVSNYNILRAKKSNKFRIEKSRLRISHHK